MGGFPGALGAPGFAPTGGGLGLLAKAGGGGLFPSTLEGLEEPGESSDVAADDFFQGVADPFPAAIPGKTETGFAEAFAVTDCAGNFVAAVGAFGAAGAGLARGGGGGAAGAAVGGTSSR